MDLQELRSTPGSLIDSHAHLNDEKYADDLPAVLDRARKAGVVKIVNVGIDEPSSARVLEQAARHEDIMYAVVGLHPHEASKFSGHTIPFFDNLAADRRVIAIGETGLDFHYDFSPREQQISSFIAHLELAESLQLPVVIHCREAYPLLAELLDSRYNGSGSELRYKPQLMVHCFSGTLQELEPLIALDCWFSLGGMVTFKKYDSQAVVRRIPAERLLLETDCPYLAPAPHRGKRNEPMYLPLIAQKIKEIRGE